MIAMSAKRSSGEPCTPSTAAIVAPRLCATSVACNVGRGLPRIGDGNRQLARRHERGGRDLVVMILGKPDADAEAKQPLMQVEGHHARRAGPEDLNAGAARSASTRRPSSVELARISANFSARTEAVSNTLSAMSASELEGTIDGSGAGPAEMPIRMLRLSDSSALRSSLTPLKPSRRDRRTIVERLVFVRSASSAAASPAIRYSETLSR